MIAQETNPAAVAAGVPKQRLEHTYDSEGRRIRIVLQTWNATTSSWTTTTDTRYAYDAYNEIANWTVDPASSAILQTQSLHWGLDLSQTEQGAGGVGGLIAIHTSSFILLPCYDGNGNITAYVSPLPVGEGQGEGVKLVTQYDYDAFGNQIQLLPSSFPIQTSYGFSTKPTDPISNWSYYTFRHYDPVKGRWTSRDPIGERGGVNLSGFIKNLATSSIDYIGYIEIAPPYRGPVEAPPPTRPYKPAPSRPPFKPAPTPGPNIPSTPNPGLPSFPGLIPLPLPPIINIGLSIIPSLGAGEDEWLAEQREYERAQIAAQAQDERDQRRGACRGLVFLGMVNLWPLYAKGPSQGSNWFRWLGFGRTAIASAVLYGPESGQESNGRYNPPGFDNATAWIKAGGNPQTIPNRGHLIPAQYGGEFSHRNIVTQDANFNQVTFKDGVNGKLDEFIGRTANPKACGVCLNILPRYYSGHDVPYAFTVTIQAVFPNPDDDQAYGVTFKSPPVWGGYVDQFGKPDSSWNLNYDSYY
jgi:RHS repeat-associated protein